MGFMVRLYIWNYTPYNPTKLHRTEGLQQGQTGFCSQVCFCQRLIFHWYVHEVTPPESDIKWLYSCGLGIICYYSVCAIPQLAFSSFHLRDLQQQSNYYYGKLKLVFRSL